ncbi:MAG: hypothetical protein NC206_07375 [Bacteroides sp.]|nr:hypothetical protein [Roseburia sp.]MCM1346892.1 hypothetical protein [Bacteroides sp.]MCM1420629.1 hypothetical protein [Bacteroides sp.]
MKKISAFAATMLMALAAGAQTTGSATQGENDVTIVPVSGTVLASKTATVSFMFSEAVSCDSIVIRGGQIIEGLPNYGQVVKKLDGFALSTEKTVEIDESYWGTAINDSNAINISLYGVYTADSVPVTNTETDSAKVVAAYTIYDPATAAFLGVEPDPDWTAAPDLFGWDISYAFSDSVDCSGAVVILEFLDEDGFVIDEEYTQTIPYDSMEAVYNLRSQTYNLYVPIPDLTDELGVFDEDTQEYKWYFAKMRVSLNGINAEGLEVPYATDYEAKFDVWFSLSKAAGKLGGDVTGIADVDASSKTVDVYSVNGTLVKNGVSMSVLSELPKGIYIVNGKKVLVK